MRPIKRGPVAKAIDDKDARALLDFGATAADIELINGAIPRVASTLQAQQRKEDVADRARRAARAVHKAASEVVQIYRSDSVASDAREVWRLVQRTADGSDIDEFIRLASTLAECGPRVVELFDRAAEQATRAPPGDVAPHAAGAIHYALQAVGAPEAKGSGRGAQMTQASRDFATP